MHFYFLEFSEFFKPMGIKTLNFKMSMDNLISKLIINILPCCSWNLLWIQKLDSLIYFLSCFYLHTIFVTNNTSQISTNFRLSHFLSKFLYFPTVFLKSLRIHLCNRCIAVCNIYNCFSKSLGCDSANRCDMQIGFLSDSNYCSCVTLPKYIGSV